MSKYFLYARKSSEAEERQVMSIEAQIDELKEFATKEKLEIVASFQEAKTAKEPGRTVFGEMLSLIQSGKADGILAWHPDRLARNSIDGGQVIYMLDTGKINSLKFPTFWFDNTPQGKFMLSIDFGQSKYYVDNLSENVKRGTRQKLRKGIWPGKAPFGYINDLRLHTILPDREKHKLVKRIFELYATGEYSFDDLIKKFDIHTQRGTLMMAGDLQRILKSPFYYGVFIFNGEHYQGTHKPAITKKLFDKVQTVMASRGKRRHKGNHGYIFTGFMNCGTCGRAITAEKHKGHVYYRCTKKNTKCEEKYLREEELSSQFKEILQKVSLSDDWTDKLLLLLEADKQKESQSSNALIESVQGQILPLNEKLDTLLDSHLDKTISKEEYLQKKEKIINEKANLEEQIREIKAKGNTWLEPMRKFILDCNQAKKIADSGDSNEIRTFLKKIGSNFLLKGKKCEYVAEKGFRILGEITPLWTVQARGESNPRRRFWRPPYYHYTTRPCNTTKIPVAGV